MVESNKNNIKGKIIVSDNMGIENRTILVYGRWQHNRENNYGFSTTKGYVYVWDEPRDKSTPQRMLIHRPINPTSPANSR